MGLFYLRKAAVTLLVGLNNSIATYILLNDSLVARNGNRKE